MWKWSNLRLVPLLWQLVVGFAGAVLGMFAVAGVGPWLVAPGSAGAYLLTALAVPGMVALTIWWWEVFTSSRGDYRLLPPPQRRPR